MDDKQLIALLPKKYGVTVDRTVHIVYNHTINFEIVGENDEV